MRDPAHPDPGRSRTRPRGGDRAERDAQASFRIRVAAPRDARGLHALMEGIYDEERFFVGDGAMHVGTLGRRLRSADPEGDLWLVGEDGTGLLGWVELHRMAPERMRHVAVLTLAVAARARGRGLGRALVRATYPWAARVGVRRIRLDVRANNVVARRLYESEGFELEGREREQIRSEDGYEDNLLMARFVDAPDART